MATTTTLPNLKRITREHLSTLLLSIPPPKPTSLVIIDVRDDDHIGGHIKSSLHIPSTTLDHATPSLVRQLQHAEKVIFHCALSQLRGPSAALKYLRERERIFGAQQTASAQGTPATKPGDGELLTDLADPAEGNVIPTEGASFVSKQEVYVLDGGFVKWQEKYGHDERLTENYAKDLWANGYY